MHFMDDMSERLRWARKKAGYETMADAAKALGVTYSTYAGHENGNREFDKYDAQRYAALFRVNFLWLLTGRGKPKDSSPKDPILELFEGLPPEKKAQAIEYLEFLASPKK